MTIFCSEGYEEKLRAAGLELAAFWHAAGTQLGLGSEPPSNFNPAVVEDQERDRPVVVCISGDDGNPTNWLPMVESLQGAAWCFSFAHDRTIEGEERSIRSQLTVTLEAIKRLFEGPPRRLWIVGHSLGATASVYLLAKGFFQEHGLEGVISIAGRLIDDVNSAWRPLWYARHHRAYALISHASQELLSDVQVISPGWDWLVDPAHQVLPGTKLRATLDGTSHLSILFSPAMHQEVLTAISEGP